MNLGRYELMGKLASGGMAEVYLAKAAGPRGFEKKLVVKRILPHLAEDASFIEMFFAEATLVAKLNHPNIVQIFDFGESNGAYFLAMEYIEGVNLRTLIKRVRVLGEKLPVALCAKLVSFVCEGLAYAHEFVEPETGTPLRLVHRDISPDNILVSAHGAVKLADFGIAKAANQLHRTETGVVKGKVAYMPPEQLQGKALDARADLFALGVVLYELLSGRKPFEAENETSLMLAILHEEPLPVTRHRGDVPESIQRIIERALSKERNARYSSCRELQLDLERYLRTCDEPVGPIDIARCIARFSPSGALEPGPTPGANRLLETPPGAPPVAPDSMVAITVAPPSRERTRTRAEDVPTELTPPPLSESPQPGDSTRTNPLQQASTSSFLGRWPMWVALGTAALVLVLAGHRLWGGTPPAVQPPPPTETSSASASGEAAQVVPEAPPDTPSEVLPPTPSAPKQEQQAAGADASPGTSTTPQPQTSPPPRTPESPQRAVAVVPASLRIESTVPGWVRVNGKSFGRTPADVKDLPPGRVTVEVFDRQQGFSKQQSTVLKSGNNGVLRLEIGKARVGFLVNPYATVFLDGKELGVTPMSPVEVYEGRHTIKLVNEKLGKQVDDKFVVKAGDTHVYKANLLR